MRTENCKLKIRNRGFTLLELIIVIAIIGIMVTIVTFAIEDLREKGRDARRNRNMEELRTSIGLYATSKLSYPNNGTSEPVFITGTDWLSQALIDSEAISRVQPDPLNSGIHRYIYESNPRGSTYKLTYCFEETLTCKTLVP
jgi:prepilin-type N-terminal cleavage/methylation domain-containing protein